MSDPVTLYRKTSDLDDFLTYSKWHEPVGEFVSRPWCATHDLPTIDETGCQAWGEDEFGLDCERFDRLVQELPE